MAYTINGENLAPRQGLGAATVLRNDFTPLRILQQGDAIRARRAQADALLKQKQAADIAKQWSEDRKLGLDTGGLFQEPFNAYTADAQDVIGKHYADEQAGRITTAERIQNIANYKNGIERERLLGIDKDKLLANYETSQAAKPYRDMQGLHTALGETVLDPTTGQRVRATAYDERANLTKLDADPRTYAADPIIGDYYKGLQASTIDEANAGRIGGIHSSSSLTYKGLLPVKRADGTWDVKRDAVGRPVIGTTADELATARASNHNLNMAVGRLRLEYDNQRQANPALPEKSDLDLFQDASQKYVSFRQADSEGRNAQPRAAARGGKLKASDAVATPTSDFHLSVGDNGGPVTETVPNPNTGGLTNFLTPTVQQTTNKSQPFDNHYPAVGVSFASERKPYVPLSVNTSQVSILGADGTPTKFNNGKANSLINLNATDRSFVLEINGKRLGLPKAGTSADAFAEMRRMVDSLTPEQARKAVLKAVYQGGTTDKASTSGDGGGGGAKVIGYKDADGEMLAGQALADARNTGQYLQPVYDKEERQLKVLTPATAQLDAQIARATPGYNPRQRTPQEAEIIRLLEAKGGRVSDPYHTTPAAPNSGGGIYKRPATSVQTTSTTKPSRGGSIYKVK